MQQYASQIQVMHTSTNIQGCYHPLNIRKAPNNDKRDVNIEGQFAVASQFDQAVL
jgi:hypothetical protein